MKQGFPELRDANVQRAIEWSNGGDGGSFYAVELFGEAGEALNVVKKLERERLGMVGSRATVDDLAAELADVIICIDLLAIAYGLTPVQSIKVGDVRFPLTESIALGRCIGDVMSAVESLEIEETFYEEYRSQDVLWMALVNAQMFATLLARAYDIDLSAAVTAKFNSTSAKYGLTTKMKEVSA